MKLNEKQLRRLVETTISESPLSVGMEINDALYDKVTGLCDAFSEYCQDEYDENDPVQREYGESAWIEQCEEAGLDLMNKISRMIDVVYQNLHNGEWGADRYED